MLSNRKGFTLIELLIVVVIIGILAAIAIPKFANTKEKAYVAAMKSDLKNLATAQEAYFSDFTTYASTTANLTFNQTAGVTVSITAATGSTWDASAVHTGTTKTCTVTYGNATNDGVPICQ
ncbi:MAG TPA: prepilin-type N-terminal cleavage/methylation domain-containing protein [Gemmatimonadaceae bacterium]|nr:prepilin-type N-terminal cleavage/methylation domain-containing protein [Gemmatimonadaceae bacterium]